MDAATDRLGREYERAVEVVRAGTIFAHNAKAHARWQRSIDHRAGRSAGLAGAALEQAIGALAISHPDLVARV